MPTQNIFNLLDTWASGGGPYTSIKMNATDNDVGSASLLMDLQVGGSSKAKVAKDGSAVFGGVGISGLGGSGLNIWTPGGSRWQIASSSNVEFNNGGVVHAGFTTNGFFIGGISYDVLLTRRGTANLRLGAADVGATTSTVTITIAAPGVVTWSNHGFSTGTPVVFTTTGALPTGITAGTTYYAVVVDANTFQLATSVANAIAATPTVITTSGSQSGTHTGTRYNITQRLGMQSITGVTDRLGADLIIQGSQGTGTGAGGSIVFQVAPAGSSGTAVNSLINALIVAQQSAGNPEVRVVNPGGGSGILVVAATSNTNSAVSIRHSTDADGTGGSTAAFLGRVSSNIGVFDGSGTMIVGAPSGSSDSIGIWGTDARIARDDANKLALRNGANAQTFRVYNTTDGTNSEFASLYWTGNTAYVASQVAGTGTPRNLAFQSAVSLYFQTNGANSRWLMDASGHFLANTDNAVDIGASGGSRPRNVYVAGQLTSTSIFTGTMNGVIGSTTTGPSIRFSATGNTIVLYNNDNTQNDFNRLQFGGTTSSFPALKRSSTTLQARLADDSAFAPVQGKLTTETAYTAGAPTATGYLVLYDSNGTAYRVPAVLN